MKFTKEGFIEKCLAARSEGQKAIREQVLEALDDPSAIFAELGEPTKAGIETLYRSPDLTVISFVWAPHMTLFPHNHEMFAVIGLYSGREDNIFWRRSEGGIEAAGAKSLGVGEAATLGKDIIHSVVNPTGKRSCALHVYGGDFFDPPTPRLEWDPETHAECLWDIAHAKDAFLDADRRASLGPAA